MFHASETYFLFSTFNNIIQVNHVFLPRGERVSFSGSDDPSGRKHFSGTPSFHSSAFVGTDT